MLNEFPYLASYESLLLYYKTSLVAVAGAKSMKHRRGTYIDKEVESGEIVEDGTKEDNSPVNCREWRDCGRRDEGR